MTRAGSLRAEVSEVAVGPLWRRLVLLFCLLIVVQDVHYAWMASGLRMNATNGITITRNECAADHFCPVTAVKADFPGMRAGIVAGDQVRFNRRSELYRAVGPGETTGLTVRHAGTDRQVTLAARPVRSPTLALYIVTAAFLALLGLTAALIAARAGTRPANLLLALAMACFAMPGNYPRLWQNAPGLFQFFFILSSLIVALAPILLTVAMRRFRKEATGNEPRWVAVSFWPLAALVLGFSALGQFIAMNAAPTLGISDGLALLSVAWAIGSLLPPLVLVTRWGAIPPNGRTRYAFMAAAVLALSAMAWVDPVIMLTTNDYNEASWPVVVQIVALTAAAFLFAYAILRHRAVDLGFAVNRTLVYSVLSGAMLGGFALAEKAAEKLLPEGAHNTPVLVQAAIALGIFMVFHRARDAVEHGVERVFFARWRDAEAKLKTFIRQARFITKPMRLVDRTVEELAAYSGGADVAVYQLIDGVYRRLGGVVGAMRRRIDLDEPAIVALRAERELQRGGLGEAALLLPMVQRAEVIGFIALGAKRDGAPYRPDEEALLTTAAQDIGFDLHALRVEDLQATNRRLSEKVASFAMA